MEDLQRISSRSIISFELCSSILQQLKVGGVAKVQHPRIIHTNLIRGAGLFRISLGLSPRGKAPYTHGVHDIE